MSAPLGVAGGFPEGRKENEHWRLARCEIAKCAAQPLEAKFETGEEEEVEVEENEETEEEEEEEEAGKRRAKREGETKGGREIQDIGKYRMLCEGSIESTI